MGAYGPSTGATSPTGRSIRPAFASILFFALSFAPARADAISDFYKSKPVTLIVSSSAGGGYDTLARTVARFLGRHLPGNPSVIGAGTWLAPAALRRPISSTTPPRRTAARSGCCRTTRRSSRCSAPRSARYDTGEASSGSARRASRPAFWRCGHAAPVASLDDAKTARDHRRCGRPQLHARVLCAADQRSCSAPSSRSSSAIPARPRP